MTTKTIILDITEAKLPPLVTVKQGDSGRTLEVVVQDGGKDFVAPLGTAATLRIMDTQGRSASVPGTVVAFGGKTTVTVGLTSEALAYAGKYAADIKLSSPDGSESTLNFWIEVQIAPASDTPIPTPGGGITREELDQALRQNSEVDQAFASAAAQTVADSTEEQLAEIREQTGIKIRPRISFVDDDGGAEIFSVLYPWMQQKNVPYTFAISVGDVGSSSKFATWDQLQQMAQSSLVDFSCHAVNDDVMSDFTAEEMAAKYDSWRGDMAAHGLPSDATSVMYNHGSYVQDTIDAVVSSYFKFGFTVTKGINATPFDSYHMKRVGLFPTDGSFTLAQAKAYVDQLAESGDGWLVFFTHCYYESFDLEELTELVEYIRSKGIIIDGVETVAALYAAKDEPEEPGEWEELEATEIVYNTVIGKASGSAPGLKTSSSSAANCVSSYNVTPGSKLKITGTAYSQDSGSFGKYSFLREDGSLIRCDWWSEPKSGANARFAVEETAPAGAATLLVSGNSGQLTPKAEVWSSGGGVATKKDLEDLESRFFESITDIENALDAKVGTDDLATSETAGVVKVNATYGVRMLPTGELVCDNVSNTATVKAGANAYHPISPKYQHEAVFFGLTKAAGVDLAGRSDVNTGIYPTDAKEAIASMLGVPTESQVTNLISAAIADVSAIADDVLATQAATLATQAGTLTVQSEILEVL